MIYSSNVQNGIHVVFSNHKLDSYLSTTVSNITVVKLFEFDEAFINFWSDALLDSISSSWLKFVVGQLKRSVEIPDAASFKKFINWIVIEQIFTRSIYVPPPAPEEPVISSTANEKTSAAAAVTPGRRFPSSPRPSTSSNLSFTAAVKHYTLFGGQDGKDGVKKKLGRRKWGLVASFRRSVSLEGFFQDNQKRKKLLLTEML
jgi:hypothetical protein